MAAFALEMESIGESNRLFSCFPDMACGAGLALPAPVIHVAVEIVVALEAVDAGRVFLVVERDGRPLVRAYFLVLERHLGILRKDRQRC